MRIVEYSEEKHYPEMMRLWKKNNWTPCPTKALPNVGLVAETENNQFISYVGMYLVPGKIGYIDWAIADSDRGIISGKALCKTVEKLIKSAIEHGCTYIYSVTKTEAWKRILIHSGLSIAERGADSFILSLDGSDTSFISD